MFRDYDSWLLMENELPKSVLVVDDDSSIIDLIKSFLVEEEIEVMGFSNSQEAWSDCTQNSYNGIILDWKLNSPIEGLAFLNRLRAHENYKQTPVIIITGFLSKKDLNILDEFLFTSKLEKPIRKDPLIKDLSKVYADSIWYQENQKNIMDILSQNSSKESLSHVLINLVGKSKNPFPMLISIGNVLSELGRVDDAISIFYEALKRKNKSAYIHNEIGKLFLKKGNLEQSSNFLKRAMALSPDNLDRLCDLGQISLEQLKVKDANLYFKKALELDPNLTKAKKGELLAKNIDGWMTKATNVPDSFASLLNAVGVNMAKKLRFQKAIDHYESSLKYVMTNNEKAKLYYNIGLCYLKWSKTEEAVEAFQESKKMDPTYSRSDKFLKKYDANFDENDFSETDDQLYSDFDAPYDNEYEENQDKKTQDSHYQISSGFAKSKDKLNYTMDQEEQETAEEKEQILDKDSKNNLSDYLFYQSSRKSITSTCLQVQRARIDIIIYSQLEENQGILLIVNDKGYELLINSTEEIPSSDENISASKVSLVTKDPLIDLRTILQTVQIS